MQTDLRQRVSSALLARTGTIAADAGAAFPSNGVEMIDPEYAGRMGRLLASTLAFVLRDGRLDPRGSRLSELHKTALERQLPIGRLFTFAYLVERISLDELSLDATVGNANESWPLVAQLVRRASFDLLAAYAERAQLEPSVAALVDRLTTLRTRPLFDAVLAKELDRAGRFGYAMSVMLFDVDRLSAINQEHGYGVGDRILERLGILMRQYFRRHDWVARYADDSMAVLLTRTGAADAANLAERVRSTVEERLGFTDHRNGLPVRVTLTVAVINIEVAIGDVLDPERLLTDLEVLVDRGKRQGRNRVERVDGYEPYSSS